MTTTWRLVVLGLFFSIVRYLVLPDLAHHLPYAWQAAARVELPLLLVLYLTLRVDTGVALTTAFWTGLLADTLLLQTLGLRALIFLVVAMVPDQLRKALLVEGFLPAWAFFLLGLLLISVLGPIMEPGPVGLLSLLPTPQFWRELGVYLLANSMILFPALWMLAALDRRAKLVAGGESR